LRRANRHGDELKSTLLLTATIDPGATLQVKRADSRQRLEDYKNALSLWLASNSFRSIVLFENSGHPVHELQQIADLQTAVSVEILSASMNESGSSLGKGHSELIAMRTALARSRLLRECDWIAKCTGRLYVPNADSLLPDVLAPETSIVCNLKHDLTFADTRFFFATAGFLQNRLVPMLPVIDDSRHIYVEHALARATAAAIADGERWQPLARLPRYFGISGTHGTSIKDPLPVWLVKDAGYRLRNRLLKR
jgi:hypothetical protein